MQEYELLRIIWWLLIGVLLGGFAVMDGFDLGAVMISPFVAKTDTERRVVINTVGPVWEGNQVWFVLAGGSLFAAWPFLYAVSFSGFYLAMFLVLVAFILRPVGFKYRSKIHSKKWTDFWDYTMAISALVIALVFGVAVGNVLQGVPFHFDIMLRSYYTGSFLGLLNPFALLAGLVSVTMIIMQGANYLRTKTDGVIRKRCQKFARIASIATIALFALAGLWILKGIKGYVFTSVVNPDGPSNPLHKTVALQTGAWMQNYHVHPWLWIAPLLGLIGAALVCLFAKAIKIEKLCLIFSSISIAGIIATVGVSMFPFILPSSSNPQSSLTVFDASASEHSLMLMLVSVIIFLPIILIYTTWVYRIMRGKVTGDMVEDNSSEMY